MAGSIVIGARQFDLLRDRIDRASRAELGAMLGAIGQTLEDSTRRRIAETKRGPDGRRWKAWSERYAKTREANHSLLRDSGALHDSLTHQVDETGKAVVVGSNLVYAGRHLFGDDEPGGIPARPYLDIDGQISDSHDREEIRDIVRDFIQGLFQ